MSGAVVTKREDLAKCRRAAQHSEMPTMSRLPVASVLPVTERQLTVYRDGWP